jgi:hypothetical protein
MNAVSSRPSTDNGVGCGGGSACKGAAGLSGAAQM